ncbi:MAG TPA: hypothetical protein VLC09_18545 [Polyangiaceae bacterium]|nr:hypothetical protein [Polyangiaceae bacterium]
MSSAQSLRFTTALVAVLGFTGACSRASAESEAVPAGEKPAAVAAAQPGAAAQAAPASEAPPAQPSYSEQTFDVSISGPTSAPRGEPVEVTVVLKAKDGFKVNPEYPIKFRFGASEAVEPELPVLKQEQAKIETYSAELRGKVKLTQPGARAVRGKLSFGVCRKDVCIPDSRELVWTITAS